MDKAQYIFLTAGISVIAFFLVKFYYLVDEIRKDVKGLLIKGAGSDEKMKGFESKLEDIQNTVHHHDKQLNRLEFQLNKNKQP